MKITKYIIPLLLFALVITAQDNLSNMYRLGKTFEQAGQFERAKEIYKQIHEKQPWNTTYLESLNEMYIRLKEYDKSIRLIDKQLKENPQNVSLYGMLGNTYYTTGDTTKAFEIWNEGLASANNPTIGYRVIINFALQNRAFKKAIEYLKEGQKVSGENDIFSLDLARVYAMTMNFDKAAVEYSKIIVEDPTKLQIVIGNMNQFLNRASAIDETINAVEEFSEENESPAIYQMLIHLYKMDNNYDKAFEYVSKLEAAKELFGKEYFNFARQALNENKFDISAKAFQKLINEYPDSPLVPSSRIGYAKTFEKSLDQKRDSVINDWKPISKPEVVFSKEYQDVIDSYKKIIDLYPSADLINEANFRIANILYSRLNKPKEAEDYFKLVEQNKITSQFFIESNLKLAEIDIKNDEIRSAEDRLKKISDEPRIVDQLKSETNLLLGKIYFWQGNYKKSSQILSKVTNNLLDDNANDALQILTLIGTLKNDSTNLVKFANAELLIFQNKFDSAVTAYEMLLKNSNMIISEFARFRKAQVLTALDKYNEALSILDDSGKLGMFAADAQFLNGEIKFFALKDYPSALAAYRNVLESYSNSLYFDKARERIEYIQELENKSI